MNNPSSAQLMYLRQCRRHQLKIKIFRVLISCCLFIAMGALCQIWKNRPLYFQQSHQTYHLLLPDDYRSEAPLSHWNHPV